MIASLALVPVCLVANVLPLIASVGAAPSRSTIAPKVRRQSDVAGGNGPCAFIFEDNEFTTFLASDIKQCLITTPFDPNVATQLVEYYRDALPFQSTLGYLKEPPPGYQQPAADLLGGLDAIRESINAGAFANEYDFEVALQTLIYSAHDGHLQLSGGLSSVFRFGSEFAISSVSVDGKELPKPYITNDLFVAQADSTFSPSPIAQINGQEAITFLAEFAAGNSFGLLENHADWNSLSWTPAADIQYLPTSFTGQSLFYPGDELIFTFENGTSRNTQWLALANIPFDAPSMSTGKEIYDYFVLGLSPDNSEDSMFDGLFATTTATAVETPAATSAPSAPSSKPTSWFSALGVAGYPDDPVVVQPSLGRGGFITGYFLDSDVGVLSIPNFEMSGPALTSFSSTVGKFLKKSKAAGIKKILIDLQQNYGGDALLATDVFKQFFPSTEPFSGSRLRVSDGADALGETYTQFWSSNYGQLNDSYKFALIDIPWAVLDFINADTGRNFSSWGEFYGPYIDSRDAFSAIQRNNISSALFDRISTGGFSEDVASGVTADGITIFGYGSRSTTAAPPYKAEDIVILTDGICHSTCAMLVEMMRQDAGVKTVTVGGSPNVGPMQAASGTRGALGYTLDQLDNDMFTATVFNVTSAGQLPESHLSFDLQFWINSASVNLRNQVRAGESVPLQFTYDASDCRIFWTKETFNDFAKLWQAAADAAWTDPGNCVQESTLFAGRKATDVVGPSWAQKVSWGGYNVGLPPTQPSRKQDQPAVPVAEFPDGQPYVAASTFMESPFDSLPTSSPSTNHSLIFGSSGSGDKDTIFLRSLTLNQPCDPEALNACDRRANEFCYPTAICSNGVFKSQFRCKRSCGSAFDCSNNAAPMFCNIEDQICKTLPSGRRTCRQQTSTTVGSGARSNSNGGKTGAGLSRPQGFCELRLREDVKCQAFYNNVNLNGITLTGPNAGGIVIVDTPQSPAQEDDDDENPVVAPDSQLPGGSVPVAGGSVAGGGQVAPARPAMGSRIASKIAKPMGLKKKP